MLFQVLGLLVTCTLERILFLELDLPLTEINKKIKCKKMWRWHAQKFANKMGMMHESKGQCIGKAPSLHLFHTTVRHAASLGAESASMQLLMLCTSITR